MCERDQETCICLQYDLARYRQLSYRYAILIISLHSFIVTGHEVELAIDCLHIAESQFDNRIAEYRLQRPTRYNYSCSASTAKPRRYGRSGHHQFN